MKAPNPPIASLIIGLIFLVGGFLFEALGRPIQPITYVPGLMLVPIGMGLGLGVLERKHKLISQWAYMIGGFGVLWYQFRAETSVLPISLYAASYSLTRFGMWFLPED